MAIGLKIKCIGFKKLFFFFDLVYFFSFEDSVSFHFLWYSFKLVNLCFYHIFLVNRILEKVLDLVQF